MEAYKFKALANLQQIEDMVSRGTLWCADWSDLNDPMEGMFMLPKDVRRENMSDVLDDISGAKRGYAVCSLSKDWRSPLLWAHYADGFRGVCLEYDLDSINRHRIDVRDVTYESSSLTYNILGSVALEDKAKEILSRKLPEWAYEREIRVFRQSAGYVSCSINSIIIGHRVKGIARRGLIALAGDHSIPIFELRVRHSGLDRSPIADR